MTTPRRQPRPPLGAAVLRPAAGSRSTAPAWAARRSSAARTPGTSCVRSGRNGRAGPSTAPTYRRRPAAEDRPPCGASCPRAAPRNAPCGRARTRRSARSPASANRPARRPASNPGRSAERIHLSLGLRSERDAGQQACAHARARPLVRVRIPALVASQTTVPIAGAETNDDPSDSKRHRMELHRGCSGSSMAASGTVGATSSTAMTARRWSNLGSRAISRSAEFR
jgi:hypothetical protein